MNGAVYDPATKQGNARAALNRAILTLASKRNDTHIRKGLP